MEIWHLSPSAVFSLAGPQATLHLCFACTLSYANAKKKKKAHYGFPVVSHRVFQRRSSLPFFPLFPVFAFAFSIAPPLLFGGHFPSWVWQRPLGRSPHPDSRPNLNPTLPYPTRMDRTRGKKTQGEMTREHNARKGKATKENVSKRKSTQTTSAFLFFFFHTALADGHQTTANGKQTKKKRFLPTRCFNCLLGRWPWRCCRAPAREWSGCCK